MRIKTLLDTALHFIQMREVDKDQHEEDLNDARAALANELAAERAAVASARAAARPDAERRRAAAKQQAVQRFEAEMAEMRALRLAEIEAAY